MANLIEFEDEESIQLKVDKIYDMKQDCLPLKSTENEADSLLMAISNCLVGISSGYFKYDKVMC